MAHLPLLRTFLNRLKALSPAFTKPGLMNALVIMIGWSGGK